MWVGGFGAAEAVPWKETELQNQQNKETEKKSRA
jgi:hypothetical protein